MTIPVLRIEPYCWDQALVWQTLDHPRFDIVDELPADADGAVVVLPARYWVDRIGFLNDMLAPLRWVLLFLVSDEESLFDWREVKHDNVRIWVMTPRPGVHDDLAPRFLGEGAPPGTAAYLQHSETLARPLDWFFAGQVNHERRLACVQQLRQLRRGHLVETPGFLQGMDRGEYTAAMARVKVVPCPSGPATPDSFRTFEALEAGCVPIVDDLCPAFDTPGYWAMVAPGAPFPVVEDWSTLPTLLHKAVADWPESGNRCRAWWMNHKRSLARRIHRDVSEMSGEPMPVLSLDDSVTVLIPTSPIPSHPETSMIEETVASVRFHFPSAEIVIMVDGVRPEQEDRRADYDEFVRRLLWLCARQWHNVVPLLAPAHLHQVGLTRLALEMIDTPTVLFVEHDTPLVTDEPIDWPAIAGTVESGMLDVVRLHHEANVLVPHKHLMLDSEPFVVGVLPVLRTTQWSQRPHVAATDYYRRILAEHFTPEAKAFLEDKLHGVAQGEPWRRNKLAIYAPGENLKRSLNLDGRQGGPKYDETQVF